MGVLQGYMVEISIPGWGDMEIENIVLDLNGTIATDGRIPPDVKGKIGSLADQVKIYILTADTQGMANEDAKDMNIEVIKIIEEDSNQGKFDFEKTVAVGNGNNDQLVLKEAGLGIAVLGDEGLSVSVIKNADVVVKNVSDALDLFLKPKRLIATLRK